MSDSAWVRQVSAQGGEEPEVFICEAYGAASPGELSALIKALEALGKFVILMWSDDRRFPPIRNSRSLLFDVSADAPYSCCYGWKVERYGPHSIADWQHFNERPILASFLGSRSTSKLRAVLFEPTIRNRPDIVVDDVAWWDMDPGSAAQAEIRFFEVLRNSKFAFCPRGVGPSSLRRWEAAYSGAIPVLINDTTQPFGIAVPAIRFTVQEARSMAENALELLAAIVSASSEGATLQARLRDCLLSAFDWPHICPWHTATRQIVAIANRDWTPGEGFRARVS